MDTKKEVVAVTIDARKVLEERGAVWLDKGCVFLSSAGPLLSGYVNCEVLFPHWNIMRALVEDLVAPFAGQFDCLACPATGDIALLRDAGALLNAGRSEADEIKLVWADKVKVEGDGGKEEEILVIERNGFVEATAGRRVLVLNDRISNGGTTTKAIKAVRHAGGEVIGVATLADVTKVSAEGFGIPKLHSLCTIDVDAFVPKTAPEKYLGLPLCIDPPLGHGSEHKDGILVWKDGSTWNNGTIRLMEP